MSSTERLILFVCTGNTCRSPMAEALATHLIAHTHSDGNTTTPTTTASAGVATIDGLPPSPEAVEVMRARGIDLSGHRSTALTTSLIERAQVVFTMTPSHSEAVMRLAPESTHKVISLDPMGPVPDPIGYPVEEYEHTAARLEELIRARLTELES